MLDVYLPLEPTEGLLQPGLCRVMAERWQRRDKAGGWVDTDLAAQLVVSPWCTKPYHHSSQSAIDGRFTSNLTFTISPASTHMRTGQKRR